MPPIRVPPGRYVIRETVSIHDPRGEAVLRAAMRADADELGDDAEAVPEAVLGDALAENGSAAAADEVFAVGSDEGGRDAEAEEGGLRGRPVDEFELGQGLHHGFRRILRAQEREDCGRSKIGPDREA